MSKEKGFRFLVVSPVIAARNGRLLKWVHSGTIAATIDYYVTIYNQWGILKKTKHENWQVRTSKNKFFYIKFQNNFKWEVKCQKHQEYLPRRKRVREVRPPRTVPEKGARRLKRERWCRKKTASIVSPREQWSCNERNDGVREVTFSLIPNPF